MSTSAGSVIQSRYFTRLPSRVIQRIGPIDILPISAGGLGGFGVQIAKAFGAEVTAVDSGIKGEMLRRIGAEKPRLRLITPEPAPLAVFESFVYLISKGALDWGPLKASRRRSPTCRRTRS